MNPTPRPIRAIAFEIYKHWPNPHPAAAPYLEAMLSLSSVHDRYVYDDGRSIVLYFLNNATTWKGEHAKRLKDELKTNHLSPRLRP